MKISVYGGSFNPFGKNHEAAITWLVDRYDLVVVVPAVAHSDKPYLPSFHHRLRMTQLGCKRFGSKVLVSEIEATMLSTYPNPILTYDVLRELEVQIRNGLHEFEDIERDEWLDCLHFAVGEDVQASMDSWDRIDLTRDEYGVVIVPTQRTHATEVRMMIAAGDPGWEDLVPESVVSYIHKHPSIYQQAPLGLYLIKPHPDANHKGYDKYRSAVVRAQSAEHARHIHPNTNEATKISCFKDICHPHDVVVTYLGPSLPGQQPGVVCANYFNG